MKRLFLALCLLASTSAFAADMPKPELFLVHEEVVKPASMMAYEAASKDFLNALGEKKVSSPAFVWTAFMSADMHYTYVLPLNGFAAMDTSQAEWEKVKGVIGAERWSALERSTNDATVSYNEFVVMRRPDLSYIPATPRVSMADRKYVRWDFYYLMPGKDKEAEAIAHDYVALFKSKNIPDSFVIYTGVLGNDLPVLIASIPAKSEADLVTADERTNGVLGADIRPLQQRAMAITRRFERREATLRPDLSYSGPPAPK